MPIPRMLTNGSSPLSRGIQPPADQHHPENRIIPALAGNTHAFQLPYLPTTDHPRSRGEYGTPNEHTEPVDGSSPLSRGIRRAVSPNADGGGIIPALAGNTLTGTPAAALTRDHPRSRGEYRSDAFTVNVKYGSSPLSRGIPHPAPAR